MIGLIIGRFQPLHNGHMELIQTASKECISIKIIIGSSQDMIDEENPFDIDSRVRMVEHALREKDISNAEVMTLEDIPDDKRWVSHVEKKAGHFDIVYAGDDIDLDFFKDTKYQTKSAGRIHNIIGTEIRGRIDAEDNIWKEFVPVSVAKIIDELMS
jgi:nicotinamide-nucleotide adenylyltransferase